MKILAIIPARGGSKGIPQKNIRKLVGKPLIQYTIEAAQNSNVNKIIVSTDDKKIAEIVRSLGIEVPFLRSKRLSGDKVSSEEVIRHVLKFLEQKQCYIPEIVLLLQPTSPLRTSEEIDRSITLLQNSKATSVVEVLKMKTHPFSAFWMKSKYLIPYKKNFEKYFQRQRYPELFYPTGSIYTFWYDTIKKYNSIYGPKIKPMISNNDYTNDIDSLLDFFVIEMIKLHWNDYQKNLGS